jgi:hypothetical protein
MLPPPDLHIALAAGALEREATLAQLEALAPLFDGAAGPRSALYVVTPDAGSHTAVRFWSEARRTGVALANPELFPWCLANAPCGAIARRFGIGGATVTWLGDEDALHDALDAARHAVAQALADRAYVVMLRFAAEPGAPAVLQAWRFDRP